jgi:hemolysin III
MYPGLGRFVTEVLKKMIGKGFNKKEELINAITHGFGALLAIAALVILVVLSSLDGTPWHVVGFAIFGSALVILYTVSTLYHGFTNSRLKELFRKFDHMAIFILIAATYTPFCLTVLNGWIGWSLFGVVWMCAAGGIILKVFATGRYESLSTALYVAMGWLVVLFIKPVYSAISIEGFGFLMIGGASYSVGVFFFMRDKVRYFHGIWHMFVLSGSFFHFFAVLTLL